MIVFSKCIMAQDGTVGNLDGRVVEFPNLAAKSISILCLFTVFRHRMHARLLQPQQHFMCFKTLMST